MFLVLFISLTLPYRLAFVNEWSLLLTLIDFVIDCFFLFDLVVNFRTGFIEDGVWW